MRKFESLDIDTLKILEDWGIVCHQEYKPSNISFRTLLVIQSELKRRKEENTP